MSAEHPIIPLTGRWMITGMFATSGVVFLPVQQRGVYERQALADAPPASGHGDRVGWFGLPKFTGYQIRIAAFVRFLYTTVVTVLFHNDWAASAARAGIQQTDFRKIWPSGAAC